MHFNTDIGFPFLNWLFFVTYITCIYRLNHDEPNIYVCLHAQQAMIALRYVDCSEPIYKKF